MLTLLMNSPADVKYFVVVGNEEEEGEVALAVVGYVAALTKLHL